MIVGTEELRESGAVIDTRTKTVTTRQQREERAAGRWALLAKDIWQSYVLAVKADAHRYLAQVHFQGPLALPPAPPPPPQPNPAG